MTFTTAPSGMPTRDALSARHSSRPTRTMPTPFGPGPMALDHDRLLVHQPAGADAVDRRFLVEPAAQREEGGGRDGRHDDEQQPLQPDPAAEEGGHAGDDRADREREHEERSRRRHLAEERTRHRRPSRSSASCRDRSPPGGYRCGDVETATIVVSNRPARTDAVGFTATPKFGWISKCRCGTPMAFPVSPM